MQANNNPLPTTALRYGGAFDSSTGVLYCGHNAGFFSNCTVTLWNIAEAQRKSPCKVARIDFSRAFSSYRNQHQQTNETDLYPLFFAQNSMEAIAPGSKLHEIKHHSLYRFIDYKQFNPWIKGLFDLSGPVRVIEEQLARQYHIDFSKTIAVVYRGTDKGIEVEIARPEAYLDQARALLQKNPGFRVLIQTDEAIVRDLFVKTLGQQCFFIQEMPVSTTGAVVHDLDEQALRMDRSEFGVMLVAVTHLLSRCAYVVNHTGNMALWICLFRGNANGVVQFDEAGGLVNFLSAEFYFRQCRKILRKVAKKLGLRRR
jgi:hypothetical protein